VPQAQAAQQLSKQASAPPRNYGQRQNSPKVHLLEGYLDTVQIKQVISPTHKRTEGRAPVWGSEFTTKSAL